MVPAPPIADRLAPALAAFATPAFRLADDLRKVTDAFTSGVEEAVVFLCARDAEALSRDALIKAGLEAGDNHFQNLAALDYYGLAPRVPCYCGHALRRLGNDARHSLRPLGKGDAAAAALLLERWLLWFFCQYPHGDRAPSLTNDGQPLALLPATADTRLADAFACLDAVDDELFRRAPGLVTATLAFTPVAAAALVERLLERKQLKLARVLIDEARLAFPADPRLAQLTGLWHSRSGELEQALAILVPLREAAPRADEETEGILAGVYKRLWLRDRARRGDLDQARTMYLSGWKQTGRRSTYLGINAAACMLWLGDVDQARATAQRVADLVLRRQADAANIARECLDNFWDKVTLAEAHLILGQHREARAIYRGALADPETKGSAEVAAQQAAVHLPFLGLSADWQEYINANDA